MNSAAVDEDVFFGLFFRWLLLYLKSPGVRCIFQDLQDRTQKCCAVQVRLTPICTQFATILKQF
jgi:hypothetical protein